MCAIWTCRLERGSGKADPLAQEMRPLRDGLVHQAANHIQERTVTLFL
jgi:hypothetical protein